MREGTQKINDWIGNRMPSGYGELTKKLIASGRFCWRQDPGLRPKVSVKD